MYWLVVVLIIGCATTFIEASEEDAGKNMALAMMEDCRKEVDATEEEKQQVLNQEPEISVNGMKMEYCFLRKLNFITKEGELDVENIMAMAKYITEDKNRLEEIEKACITCKTFDGSDCYEITHKVVLCLKEKEEIFKME